MCVCMCYLACDGCYPPVSCFFIRGGEVVGDRRLGVCDDEREVLHSIQGGRPDRDHRAARELHRLPGHWVVHIEIVMQQRVLQYKVPT